MEHNDVPEDEVHLEEFGNVDPNGKNHAGESVQQEPEKRGTNERPGICKHRPIKKAIFVEGLAQFFCK